jgi:alkanesulfonate monooxygenase SsuD/methylene tetrahydromethanopterin reductase-like flavin-dependent oxidoreductase (luciferase family)
MTPFRFGAVAAVRGPARAWRDTAVRLESAGYSALLTPDTLWTPSPFPALAAVAASTTTLHIGTWVLAAPLRSAAATVRETRTLAELADGRFELGIGAGRPGGEKDAEALGVPWGTPGQRVDHVEATIAALRGALGDSPHLTMAAAGDRMLRLAGRHAQTLALPLAPTADTAAVAEVVARVRAATPADRPPLELALQVVGVGDDVPEWMRRNAGVTPESLRESGAAGLLSGDSARDADALFLLREATGVSFITVPDEFSERLETLVGVLSGT